jgi:hypothetical protein
MGNAINIKTLTLSELVGVTSLYPWYGGARKELCVRMSRMGAEAWGLEQYADAAMYVANRRAVSDILRKGHKADLSDKDVQELLKSYEEEASKPKVRVVGGDFFTQAQYDNVRREEDNVFSKLAAKAKKEPQYDEGNAPLPDEFCTETLASIYAEQGYFAQAKHIYSRLLLKFPEKNTYFASLIKDLDSKIRG